MERDRGMLAGRAARGNADDPPPPDLGGLKAGCLIEGPRTGELFPQAMKARTSTGVCGRLDDLLGPGFWLIARDNNARGDTLDWPTAVSCVVVDRDVSDESGRLRAWLEATGAPAVLVRPDRYIFGAGTADALNAALREKFAR